MAIFGREVSNIPAEFRPHLATARSFQAATLYPGLTVTETYPDTTQQISSTGGSTPSLSFTTSGCGLSAPLVALDSVQQEIPNATYILGFGPQEARIRRSVGLFGTRITSPLRSARPAIVDAAFKVYDDGRGV